MSDDATARGDELAIFIDGRGTFRILVPNDWTQPDFSQVPEFAYLAVAAVVRLARGEEVEFRRALSDWADRKLSGDVSDSPKYQYRNKPKKH